MELLSHAVKGGANKMSVTARANRMLSLSPFIKNSCYLKSLYPQHFFILSFEDLFFLHSFTRSLLFQQHSHTRTVTPSFECESDCLSMHCSRVALDEDVENVTMNVLFFICCLSDVLLVKALSHCSCDSLSVQTFMHPFVYSFGF